MITKGKEMYCLAMKSLRKNDVFINCKDYFFSSVDEIGSNLDKEVGFSSIEIIQCEEEILDIKIDFNDIEEIDILCSDNKLVQEDCLFL